MSLKKTRIPIVSSLIKLHNFCFASYFNRIRFLSIVIVTGFALITARLIYIFLLETTAHDEGNGKLLYNSTQIQQNRIFQRADIVDRNGEILARNLPAANLYLDIKKVFDIDLDLEKLITIFPEVSNKLDKIRNEYLDKKSLGKSGLIIIKKNILPIQQKQVLDKGVIGAYFEETQKRVYLYKNIASHLVGFMSMDGVGVLGAEGYFNKYLIDPKNKNKPLQLSIDINIQSILRDILARSLKKYNAKGAFSIIANIKTGEIISAISLPDFNPNNINAYNSEDMFNRFSLGVYELGSVFKVFLAAIAVKEGMSLTKQHIIDKSYTVDDFTIKDFRFIHRRETMSIIEMLKYSSNVGCAQIAGGINVSTIQGFFTNLGFGEKVNIELLERGLPLLPNIWFKSNAITASYGHGIAITPLHFTSAVGGILNEGILIEPTILKVNHSNQTKVKGRIINAEESIKVRHALQLVSEGNTRMKDAIKYYNVGGKSGTAIQVVNKKYDRKKMILSFFVGMPMSDPQYVIYIGMQEPNLGILKGERFATGGHVIVPIIEEVAMSIGEILRIKQDNRKPLNKN